MIDDLRLCFTNEYDLVNDDPHRSQSYGFSPVCVVYKKKPNS